jgi:signal transduction histidine kinase/ActR/RegA family two-component response regulator
MKTAPALIPDQTRKAHELLLAQVRLLYVNTHVGVWVTIIAATVLSSLEWDMVSHSLIGGWWTFMLLVSVARYAVALAFGRAAPAASDAVPWVRRFALAIALAGIGWGGAGILFYSEASLPSQVFLVFVIGGMMLGAASLLSARPEAFLSFLIPAGFATSARMLLQRDQTHLAMGLLGSVFTIAVLITTWRVYRILDSSLRLQFENLDLLKEVRAAHRETEALNQALEVKVQERTAELTHTTQQLRVEIENRERTEEELLRARKLESLGVLAGGIAHDFNNFLMVVEGNIEIARGSLPPDAPVLSVLDQMALACHRATFLSSQLLTFAKGGAPVRRLVSIKDLLIEAVNLVRAGSSLSVELNIANDLRFAYLDPGQIGQVLHNILLNARQAMPGGGIIEVTATNADRHDDSDDSPRVSIAIRDYGCGIPANIRPRIFDPYFTTKPGGSGLGLATAYAIVAKHGGNIMVESTPGTGSVFTIDLPASYDVPAPRAPVASRSTTRTEHLLVMDDEPSLRDLLKILLGRHGYEVQTARDGAEAIALYEKAMAAAKPFDAVILDLTVSGGMGGVEAAGKIRELDPSAKLIVSSGYSASSVMSEFARYGFAAVLPKPWSLQEIDAIIRSVLTFSPDRTPE